MDTHFAPAIRSEPSGLDFQINTVRDNPIIDSLLLMVDGLLAVLNENRQILAVNETLLHMLGVADAGEILGLRPGEAIGCVHAEKMPGGCGTSEYCASCGAAIAIVSALADVKPVERACAMTAAVKGGGVKHLYFRVKAYPISFNGEKILLLFSRISPISRNGLWRSAPFSTT